MGEEALFGRWLRKRRRSLGLTQGELAERVGCSAATVRKIEADERRPSQALAGRLAELLEVSRDERDAFIAFARGGWSDLPPPAALPLRDRPWLWGSGAAGTAVAPEDVEEPAAHPAVAELPSLVARGPELARLESQLARALAGRGQVALVAGEAGQGKTALLQAFAHRARESRPELLVAWGSCNAYSGPGDPYLPFREILQLLLGNAHSGLAGTRLGRAHLQSLARAAPRAAAIAAEAGPELLGVLVPLQSPPERPGAPLPGLGPKHAPPGPDAASGMARGAASGMARGALPAQAPLPRAALLAQYLAVIVELSRHRPLLLVLDDLQWIDRASADLLLHLGRRLSESRVMLLGSFRESEVAVGREDGRHPLAAVVNELRREHGDVVLDLDRLQDRGFVDAWLDLEPNRLGEEFRAALGRQTGGHPLFTIELLRSLEERGDLARDEAGSWVARPDLGWQALPARIEGVIDERLGRLAPHLLEWLRVAAVEGEEFTGEVVARVVGAPGAEVRRALSAELSALHRLIAAQEVRRLDGSSVARYRFRHNLIQRRVYEQLDTVQRTYLHEAVAEAIAALFESRIGEAAAQLAHHYREAGALERAAPHLRHAGRNARRAGALAEAIGYYREALQHWPDPRSRDGAAARRELAECLWLDGQLAEAHALLAQAFEEHSSLGDLEGAGAAQRLMGRVCWEMGVRTASLDHYRRSLEILQAGPEGNELAWTLSSVSQMHMLASEYDEAVAWGERALELAQRIGSREVVAHALNNIGTALLHGRPERAERAAMMLAESRSLALDLGLAHDACRAAFNLAEALRARGRSDEARALLHELLPYAERLGVSLFVASGRAELFDLERRSGRWREAFASPAWTERQSPGAGGIGHAWTLTTVYLAAAHTDLRQPEAALALLDAAESTVTNQQELQVTLPYLGERIRALAALERHKQVEEHVERLLEVLAEAPFTIHGASRALLAACHWSSAGRGRRPHELLGSCVAELRRLERQYGSPSMNAAMREGEGWLALLEDRLEDAAARLQEAERLWEQLGLPLDRLRALRGAARALTGAGRPAESGSAVGAANAILDHLTAQVGQLGDAAAERLA